MPFRSQSQRRLFYAKMKRGEISKKTVAEWESETRGKLPERAKKKRRQKIHALHKTARGR